MSIGGFGRVLLVEVSVLLLLSLFSGLDDLLEGMEASCLEHMLELFGERGWVERLFRLIVVSVGHDDDGGGNEDECEQTGDMIR